MEKQSREEILMQKLMGEGGLEKPSVNFSANVMKAIAVKKVVVEYKPLISKKAWTIILGVVGILFLGIFQYSGQYSLIPNFSFPQIQTLSIPDIPISRTMTWAIAFVALFLLEVPFLKRLIERQ